MAAGGSSCELCAAKSGRYDLGRDCCCLRLLAETPRNDARAAMWAHMVSTMPEDRIEALRACIRAAGASKEPA